VIRQWQNRPETADVGRGFPALDQDFKKSFRFMRLFPLFEIAVSVVFSASAFAAGFDAATIRRADHGEARLAGMKLILSPTRLTMSSVSLGYCLAWAFDTPSYQIVAPNWVSWPQGVRYDINAIVGSPVSEGEMKGMLRNLLSERLSLTVHHEKRELPVYGLVVEKGGHKMRQPSNGEVAEIKPDGPYKYIARNTPIATLIRMLEPPFTSRPVVDMTGLDGGYDFTLDLSASVADAQTGSPIAGPGGGIDWEGTLLAALPRQLGLRLEQRKAPFEMLVVDSASKDPVDR
jgi:uncharacterized protein (TIGR03435 family)